MKPKGSLPCSQRPTTCPCPEQNNPHHFLKIIFNILRSTSRFSKWSFPFRFPYWNFACTSYLSHACHMPCPFRRPCMIILITSGEENRLLLLLLRYYIVCSWGSSVGRVRSLRPVSLRNQSSIPGRQDTFLSFLSVHISCEAHPAFYPMGTGSHSPEENGRGVKFTN
jgi:hypothetical protein